MKEPLGNKKPKFVQVVLARHRVSFGEVSVRVGPRGDQRFYLERRGGRLQLPPEPKGERP